MTKTVVASGQTSLNASSLAASELALKSMRPSARSTLRWRALRENSVKARASLSANSAASSSSAAMGFQTLIATGSPVAVVLAMTTLPNVPSPKVCRRVYSERRFAGKGGGGASDIVGPSWGHGHRV